MCTVRQIALLSLFCVAPLFLGVHAEEREIRPVTAQTTDLRLQGDEQRATADATQAQQPNGLEFERPLTPHPQVEGQWLRIGDDTDTALQQPRTQRWVF